jgi:lipopolysaccharide transport system ATP-binding protein
MEAVRKLCMRGILLENGRVVTIDEVESIVRKYVDGGATPQAVYEIPLPPKHYDLPGYAYRLTIENTGGNPASSIPVGLPWQVSVRFKIARRTEHCVVALGVMTSSNIPFRTSWSTPQTLDPGDYEAVFREDTIFMAPARYSLTVGLSTHERPFHYREDAGVLEIAEFSEGIDLIRLDNVGSVLNPLKVTIRKAEQLIYV